MTLNEMAPSIRGFIATFRKNGTQNEVQLSVVLFIVSEMIFEK
jgi:hypothetical protein